VETISRVADDWLGISQHTPGQCRVADFAGIRTPTLLVCGERTRSAARAIVECLLETIPEAESIEIPAAGHLSPISHPEAVNEVVAGFLGRWRQPQEAGQQE
jgi:pimeloyl-ACP methyl ester carboxylesterase